MTENTDLAVSRGTLLRRWQTAISHEYEGLRRRAMEEALVYQRLDRASFVLGILLTSCLFVGLVAELPTWLSWVLAFMSLGATLTSLSAGRRLKQKEELHRAATEFGDAARRLDERLADSSEIEAVEVRAIRGELKALTSTYRDYTTIEDPTKIKLYLGESSEQ